MHCTTKHVADQGRQDSCRRGLRSAFRMRHHAPHPPEDCPARVPLLPPAGDGLRLELAQYAQRVGVQVVLADDLGAATAAGVELVQREGTGVRLASGIGAGSEIPYAVSRRGGCTQGQERRTDRGLL